MADGDLSSIQKKNVVTPVPAWVDFMKARIVTMVSGVLLMTVGVLGATPSLAAHGESCTGDTLDPCCEGIACAVASIGCYEFKNGECTRIQGGGGHGSLLGLSDGEGDISPSGSSNDHCEFTGSDVCNTYTSPSSDCMIVRAITTTTDIPDVSSDETFGCPGDFGDPIQNALNGTGLP